MRGRRAVILGLGGAAGAVTFMLGLGAWLTRSQPAGNAILPMPLSMMGWQLTDHRGQSIRPADWSDRPVIAFFGFTWCPDVCPTTLADISGWLEDLGHDADRLVVALISVDPDRDSPQLLGDYLANFDPRIIGLTGAPVQIARAAAEFRVTYRKVPREDGDYMMDHTAGVFLFYADGRFASIIDFHEDRRFAVPKIKRILN